MIIENILRFIIGNSNIWAPILVLIIGFLDPAARVGGCPAISKLMLRWFMLLVIGVVSLIGFVFHIFFAETTAHMIGWANSPFQYEVGIANLAFGVLGVLAFIINHYKFSLATGIGFAIWFFGDGVGHIYQLAYLGNTAAYNAGSTLYTDILLPIMVVLLLIFARERGIN